MRRSPATVALLLIVAGVLCSALIGLGIWQVERRSWKLALIARVEQRIHAPAVPAPGPPLWPHITDTSDGYRHVTVTGRFRDDRATLVQAVTERGPGFWVMTPLVTDRGFTVLVNRGFVPARAPVPPGGSATVTGLLRLTEPKGAFLRYNDPATNRWYSRDVSAISSARGLDHSAPYFIDADAGPATTAPVGGLTVVHFTNNHLVYALTWFALALMVAGAAALMLRPPRRL